MLYHSASRFDASVGPRARSSFFSRTRVVAAAYAIWLVALPIIPYLSGGWIIEYAQVVVLCAVIPVLLQYHCNLVGGRLSLPALIFFALFAELFTINFMVNTEILNAFISIVYALNVLFIMAIGICISRSPGAPLIVEVIKSYAIVSFPSVVFLWWGTSDISITIIYGLSTVLHKNLVGFFAFTTAVAALLLRPGILKILIITFCVIFIADLGARTSFLALVGAILAFLWFMQMLNGRRLVPSLWLITIISFLVLLSVYDPLYRALYDLIWVEVLAMEDPGRGLQSGLTGRFDIWSVFAKVWYEDGPLLGIGYKNVGASPQITLLPTGYSHNGYLSVLVELGLFGFVLYIAIIFAALRNVVKASIVPLHKAALLAYLVGYGLYNVTEGRPLNVGNPFTVLMMLIWMCSFTLPRQPSAVHQARRRLHLAP